MFCSFCKEDIPKGTGELFVLKDGTTLAFCSSKCKRNQVKLKREGRTTKWTSKRIVLSTEKKEVEKKDSALAKEIEKKLEAQKGGDTGAKK